MEGSINLPYEEDADIPKCLNNNIDKSDLSNLVYYLNRNPIIVTLNKFRFPKDGDSHTILIFSSITDDKDQTWIVGMDPDAQSYQKMGRFCLIRKEYLIEKWNRGHRIMNVY